MASYLTEISFGANVEAQDSCIIPDWKSICGGKPRLRVATQTKGLRQTGSGYVTSIATPILTGFAYRIDGWDYG